ncbi:MAG: acetyl-CoA carboxylase biotin carboxylase subunit [Candidatus Wallbacteria bacterium]|nr:acetyl-CoA carboxylase biotin carboxylase subunit [Candidatus Wallbacteria bacterium]
MMKKILIANRGEIALRIVRAVKELGMAAVVVYTDGERESLPVRFADEAYSLGPDDLLSTYLNIELMVETAKRAGCSAIHPGYGFLAENAVFARAVRENGMIFIGPSPEIITSLGDKIEARKLAEKIGVPVIPGYNGEIKSGHQAKEIAGRIGYPLILKAAHGGGGRGMRIVTSRDMLVNSVKMAVKEALSAFGNGTVFMERFVENAKHVEVQVLSDLHGNTVHLFERDCSIQRRHQKMIEEAPCFMLDDKLRKQLYSYALLLVKATGYCGAGTVEFLYDGKTSFYFLEVNPRIQVEHPVTEMITGVDIVKEQIRCAMGEKLSVRQKDLAIRGSAMECRILAEEVTQNGEFKPSFGRISDYIAPAGFGVRTESCAFTGYEISPRFDSLIAKVITHGKDSKEALRKMELALAEIRIEGLSTNIPFLRSILNDEEFQSGYYFTNFLDVFRRKQLTKQALEHHEECAAIAAALLRFREERKRKPVVQRLKHIISRWNLAGRTESFRARKGF